MRRELQALTHPLVFMDFMEIKVEVQKQDGDQGLDENKGIPAKVREELTEVGNN